MKARYPIIMYARQRGLAPRVKEIRAERAAFSARSRDLHGPLPQPVELLNLGQRVSLLENGLREHRREFAEHRHHINIFMDHVLDFQAVLAQ